MSALRSTRSSAGWRCAVLALAALFGSMDAGADTNPLAIQSDASFAGSSFTTIPSNPSADAGSPVTFAGLAAMPHGGGYIVATTQPFGGAARTVLSRYLANGAIDSTWGTNGQQVPALGTPAGLPHVVVGEEAGQDIFYLAYSTFSSSTYSVAVAKFHADGSFDANFGAGGYVSSDLHVTVPTGISLIRDAAFTVVDGVPMLIVMVGVSNNKFAFTRAAGSGAGALSDDGASALVSNMDPIYTARLQAHGPNHVSVVGSISPAGWYGDYNAGAHSFSARQFAFQCSPGVAANTTLEAVAWPAAFGGDALVAGKLGGCTTAKSAVARVHDLGGTPSIVWQSETGDNSDGCASNFSPCPNSLLAYSDARPDVAITITPTRQLVPVRLRDGKVLGSMDAAALNPGITYMPTNLRDYAYDGRRLLGMADEAFIGMPLHGLGALLIDGLFADGFE